MNKIVKLFFSLISVLYSIPSYCQEDEVPLMNLGSRQIDYVTLEENGSNYYFNTHVFGRKQSRAPSHDHPQLIILNKYDFNTHAIIKSAILAGDTIQTDSIVAPYERHSCLSRGEIFFVFNRYYPDDTAHNPKQYKGLSLVVMDTNLNTVVPEKQLLIRTLPYQRFVDCEVQSICALGERIFIGYVEDDTLFHNRAPSHCLITDRQGNILKDTFAGWRPRIDSTKPVYHELAETIPYGNDKLLLTGTGMGDSTNGNFSFAITDSNLNVQKAFIFAPAFTFGSGGYNGYYDQSPNAIILPTGSIITGRDYEIKYGPNNIGSVVTGLAKMKAAPDYGIDTTVIFLNADTTDGVSSAPSVRDLTYNLLDNRIYYANANRLPLYSTTCTESQNYVQVVCLDTNMHSKWRKYLAPTTNSCAVVTITAISRNRPGFDVLGEYYTSSVSNVSAFLFHVDSTGTLDAGQGAPFTIRDRFRVYPNPASTFLKIDDLLNGIESMCVIDMQGRAGLRTKPAANPAILDLSSLPAGPYIIRLGLKDGTAWSQTFMHQ